MIESKLAEGGHDPFGIFRIGGHPEVNLFGGPGVSVVGDGIPADEEVLDTFSVEQVQEVFEVLRKPDFHS